MLVKLIEILRLVIKKTHVSNNINKTNLKSKFDKHILQNILNNITFDFDTD